MSFVTSVANGSQYPIYVSVDDSEGSAKRKGEEMIKRAAGESAQQTYGESASKESGYEQTGALGFTMIQPGGHLPFRRGETKTAFVTIFHYYSLLPKINRGLNLVASSYRVYENMNVVLDKHSQIHITSSSADFWRDVDGETHKPHVVDLEYIRAQLKKVDLNRSVDVKGTDKKAADCDEKKCD